MVLSDNIFSTSGVDSSQSSRSNGSGADALAKIRSERAGSELLARLLIEESDGAKQMIALAVGACGYRPAIPGLMTLLEADSGMLRGCAAWSLGELVAVEAEDALVNRLLSESREYPIERIINALKKIRESAFPTRRRSRCICDGRHEGRASARFLAPGYGNPRLAPS